MASLAEKSAVVTGACGGIGYEVVKAFLEQGIKVTNSEHMKNYIEMLFNCFPFMYKNVALIDICDTKNVTNELQSKYKGQQVLFIQTDVSKKDQMKSAFDQIIKAFGNIDIVVGNAGILCETDYERTINVNLVSNNRICNWIKNL